MLVKNWMKTPAVTIDEDESMSRAAKLMGHREIKMIPVLKKGKLTGIVTDRDIKRASASDATTLEIHELLYLLSTIRIREIMSRPVISVPPDFTVEETAQVLLENNISGVPVVGPHDEVVGTITATELFEVLISLTGVGKKGIQFAFELIDQPGVIGRVADKIRAAGGRIVSILSAHNGAPLGCRQVFIRAFGLDRHQLQTLKTELFEGERLRYLVDHRENRREVYD
jgi:acetoin utilization protein AcuB